MPKLPKPVGSSSAGSSRRIGNPKRPYAPPVLGKRSPRSWPNLVPRTLPSPRLRLSCPVPGHWASAVRRRTCLLVSPRIRNPGRAAAFSLQLREPSQSPSGLHPGSFGHFCLSLGEGEDSLKSEICSSNSNNYHCNDYYHFYYHRHHPILIVVIMVSSSKPVPQEAVRVQRSPASEDATSGSGLRRVHFAFENTSQGFIFTF